MRQAMVLHNQYRWDRAKTRVTEVGKLHDDDFVVVFHPRSDDVLQFIRRVKGVQRVRPRQARAARVAPADAAAIRRCDVRARFTVMPRLEARGRLQGRARPAPTTTSSAMPRTAGRP